MKKFITDPSFWALFPQAAIGVLAVEGIDAAARLSPDRAAEVEALLREANAAARGRLDSAIPLSQNPAVALWREAYQKFPTKKGARCSIEALLKRASKGEGVGPIAPMVDITNAISLKYALPIGVEDLSAFQGDLHLGVMAGGEDFLPIGGEEPDPPRPGEVAYYDQAGAVCRCWNWRDGQRTAVTAATTRAFIAMECLEADRLGELQSALEELSALLEQYLRARAAARGTVTAAAPEMVLEA